MEDKIILLVEDNDDDREIIRRAWRASGIWNRIVYAADGQQALNYLLGDAPDRPADPIGSTQLVVLDLHMPGMGGLECLRRLRADERTRHLPVVVLTGSESEDDMVQATALGVTAYIRKSLNVTEFLRATAELGLKWIVMRER